MRVVWPTRAGHLGIDASRLERRTRRRLIRIRSELAEISLFWNDASPGVVDEFERLIREVDAAERGTIGPALRELKTPIERTARAELPADHRLMQSASAIRVGSRVRTLVICTGEVDGEQMSAPAGSLGTVHDLDLYDNSQGLVVTILFDCGIVNSFDADDGPLSAYLEFAPRAEPVA